MAKNLNKILSESADVPNNVQQDITEAWESKLTEAREEITANLREEFAKKYEHDKGVLAEAMDNFLTDKIRVELEEFAKDKKNLIAEQVAYKTNLEKHTTMLNKFVTEQVAKEIKELRSDKVTEQGNFKKLENFLLKQLSEEIRDFRKDKRELVEQKVKMVSEGKQHLEETKQAFIKRAAKLVEDNINKVLSAEIGQFKDDIKVARENEFGRRIYESFVGEYMTSYLNEGTEVSKLQKVLEGKDATIGKYSDKMSKAKVVVESLQSKLNVANDRIDREKVMSEMMAPLAKHKQAVMNDLLESVQTKDLERAFNKYLPAVLNETTSPAKPKSTSTRRTKVLSERTGNRAKTALTESAQDDLNSDLAELKALAGLK